jgi:tetratricopeptide (TPR) repeat protein
VIQTSSEGSVVEAIESGSDPHQAILAEILVFQAYTLSVLGRFPEAADCLERALKLTIETGVRASHRSRRKRAWILKWLAEVFYFSGRYREAAQSCREALELVPNEPKAHERLAEILANCPDPGLRDPAEAIRIATRGIELSPEDRHIRRALGMAHYRAGNWPAAVEAIRKSMELGAGGEALDWLFLAMARWRQGDRDEARRWYDKAVAWIDDHPSAEGKLRDTRREAAALIGPKATATTEEGATHRGR